MLPPLRRSMRWEFVRYASHMTSSIEPGLTGEARRVVRASDLATALGSGDVPVFGTPALCALMEEASVAAVAHTVPPGSTTVGSRIELDHVAPSREGAEVRAEARLEHVDRRMLTFACEAYEGDTLIGRARHLRVVVDRARFA